jgi:hypothetical protein
VVQEQFFLWVVMHENLDRLGQHPLKIGKFLFATGIAQEESRRTNRYLVSSRLCGMNRAGFGGFCKWGRQ